MRVLEYRDARDRAPFREWFDTLDRAAAAKVEFAVRRLEQGNTSNLKSVGDGLYEYRIHFGPGYRVYLGYEGTQVVILLGGGTKKRQDDDIETARWRWADFQRRKARGGAKTWH
jgi:putative addiction module killer protein